MNITDRSLCIGLAQRIEGMLHEYRTITLEGMYNTAILVEMNEFAPPEECWLSGMLASYLKDHRAVAV